MATRLRERIVIKSVEETRGFKKMGRGQLWEFRNSSLIWVTDTVHTSWERCWMQQTLSFISSFSQAFCPLQTSKITHFRDPVVNAVTKVLSNTCFFQDWCTAWYIVSTIEGQFPRYNGCISEFGKILHWIYSASIFRIWYLGLHVLGFVNLKIFNHVLPKVCTLFLPEFQEQKLDICFGCGKFCRRKQSWTLEIQRR